MASKLSSQLKSDPLSSKGIMGDFTHASNLFVDGDMRLAPKVKFLYHVVFDINTNALLTLGFKYKNQNEINMLVKSADLPKFAVQTDVKHQYNRKKVVQQTIDYQPVNIVFHDDNYGVTRKLWENYYNYYFADQTATKIVGGYDPRNQNKSGRMILSSYGLDNASTAPFFNSITIHQMAKGKWNSYKLINPIISTWNHDTLDYSSSNPVENNMTLLYEAVQYDSGTVSENSPQGFATEHYDKTPSPLSLSPTSSTNSGVTTTAQVSGTEITANNIVMPGKGGSLMTTLSNGNTTPGPIGGNNLTSPTTNNTVNTNLGSFRFPTGR